MGEAAQAQQDIGGVQFAAVAVDTETGLSGSRGSSPAGLRPADESAAARKPDLGRRADGPFRCPLRESRPRQEHGKDGECKPREATRSPAPASSRDQSRRARKLSGPEATHAYCIAEPANIATAPAIARRLQRDRRPAAFAADDAAAALAALGKLPGRS